jgi:rubredoxin
MQTNSCNFCGYCYDPARATPANGLAPGVDFCSMPEDWCCPSAGSPPPFRAPRTSEAAEEADNGCLPPCDIPVSSAASADHGMLRPFSSRPRPVPPGQEPAGASSSVSRASRHQGPDPARLAVAPEPESGHSLPALHFTPHRGAVRGKIRSPALGVAPDGTRAGRPAMRHVQVVLAPRHASSWPESRRPRVPGPVSGRARLGADHLFEKPHAPPRLAFGRRVRGPGSNRAPHPLPLRGGQGHRAEAVQTRRWQTTRSPGPGSVAVVGAQPLGGRVHTPGRTTTRAADRARRRKAGDETWSLRTEGPKHHHSAGQDKRRGAYLLRPLPDPAAAPPRTGGHEPFVAAADRPAAPESAASYSRRNTPRSLPHRGRPRSNAMAARASAPHSRRIGASRFLDPGNPRLPDGKKRNLTLNPSQRRTAMISGNAPADTCTPRPKATSSTAWPPAPPGAQLPEDRVCPKCGAEKEFSKSHLGAFTCAAGRPPDAAPAAPLPPLSPAAQMRALPRQGRPKPVPMHCIAFAVYRTDKTRPLPCGVAKMRAHACFPSFPLFQRLPESPAPCASLADVAGGA